jgi:protein-tyrosine-phosphatase
VEKADFARYDRIVAMSELEHRPMLEARYLAHCQMVEYFEVGDLPLEEPKDAMNKIARLMEHMMKQLVNATKTKLSISV